MEFKHKTITFLIVILLAIIGISSCEASEIASSLNKQFGRNHGAIQSEDGDVIDCVDVYKQPAFTHPALKNHTIQMAPAILLNNMESKTVETAKLQSATQIWQRSGSCPEGTIPILRRKPGKTSRMRKRPNVFHLHQDDKDFKHIYVNRSVAMVYAEAYAFYGGRGDIMVWNPEVGEDDEYSTSQVALKSGPMRKSEVVESGWAVNPSVYGDRKTRLFVYWTADGSVDTGCFDLTCPGFVQTNNEIALGAAIYPISNPTGLPSQISITILKDGKNWWLIYGEKTAIGYWPGGLFRAMSYHAETVQWGGEVYSSRMSEHPHPAIGMGSGVLPDYISTNAGTVERMRVAVNSQTFTLPLLAYSYTDEFPCYDAVYIKDYVLEPVLYYGGPGRSPACR